MDRTTDNRRDGARLQGHSRDAVGTAGGAAPLSGGDVSGGLVWVEMPFPIKIRVKDSAGAPVDMESVLDRLSPRNLYLRLATQIVEGTGLQAIVRLSVDPEVVGGAMLAVCGNVAHVRLLEDGTYGTEVDFTRRWFLYAS